MKINRSLGRIWMYFLALSIGVWATVSLGCSGSEEGGVETGSETSSADVEGVAEDQEPAGEGVADEVPSDAYTPMVGSEEYQDIIAALLAGTISPDSVVDLDIAHFLVLDDWAYIVCGATPRNFVADPANMAGLLKRVDGEWEVVESGVGTDLDPAEFLERLPEDAPAEILTSDPWG